MDELDIKLNRHSGRYLPLEELMGEVAWHLAQEPRSIAAHLLWRSQGKGLQDVVIVASEQITSLTRQGSAGFSFLLPAEPYSFSGELISLAWCVEVSVDGGRVAQQAAFTLSASGSEVLLYPPGK